MQDLRLTFGSRRLFRALWALIPLGVVVAILTVFAMADPPAMRRLIVGAAPEIRDPAGASDMPARAFCGSSRPFEKPSEDSYWNGWGGDLNNRRSQTADMAGLSPDQLGRLKLKWAFGIPGESTSSTQPTLAGGRLFFGSSTGKVYSVDEASGCVHWVFDAGAPVRTAITIGMNGGRWVAYFGDSGSAGAHAFAVDAATGQLIWKATADESVYAHISGSPALADRRLYVPVTGNEDAHASNPEFQCCWFRGSLVALDAVTGKSIWKSYTVAEPARPRDTNSRGVRRWGPSGAGIWSAPTVDMVRRAIYVGTGDSHSQPAASTSDAILAFDMDTGAMLWSRQKTRGDAWNVACEMGDSTNCPEGAGPDFDFGSPPILVDLTGGRHALIAGQKSGVVYALDPDNRGEELWRAVVGQGGFVGGIQAGSAVDRENVYVALSDLSSPFSNPSTPDEPWWRRFRSEFGWLWTRAMIHMHSSDDGGGTFALSLESGRRIWHTGPQCDGADRCRPAQPGAVTVIPGVAFSGTIDGHMRGYSTKDGHVIWTVGTARSYPTVNGVVAHGGSLAGQGPVVAGGVLYVASGYPAPRGSTGNVLLAYSIDGK